MPSRPVRGRSDRIAFIHAVYAVAWAGMVSAPPAPLAIAFPLLGASLLVMVATGLALRGAPPSDDPAAGAAIVRINVATAVAIVVAVAALHAAHADRWIVPAVLAVMAIHFLPLFVLLRRRSLPVIGGALLLAAILPWAGLAPWTAPIAASAVFLVNAIRLAIGANRLPRPPCIGHRHGLR